MARNTMGFETWKQRLDVELQKHTGFDGVDELPDLVDLWPLYADGTSPATAAKVVLDECGFFAFSL